jgi:hypothetical protein
LKFIGAMKINLFDEEMETFYRTFITPVDYNSYKEKFGKYFEDNKHNLGYDDQNVAV